jgi:hypothetical protein
MQEMQAEIEQLKIEISTPRSSVIHSPPTMKDVTLVAGIKDWTGDSRGRTVYEFFSQTDTYAKVSNWAEDEKALIAKAKLQGIALQYVQGREFLSSDACTYTILKEHLIDSAKRCLPSITTPNCRMPHRKNGRVWKSLQIGVGACVRKQTCGGRGHPENYQ